MAQLWWSGKCFGIRTQNSCRYRRVVREVEQTRVCAWPVRALLEVKRTLVKAPTRLRSRLFPKLQHSHVHQNAQLKTDSWLPEVNRSRRQIISKTGAMSLPNFNIVYTALPLFYEEDQEGYAADEEHKAYLDRLAAAQPDHPSRGTQPFPFMKLSAELRNKIYDLATDVDVYVLSPGQLCSLTLTCNDRFQPKIRPQAGDQKTPRGLSGGPPRIAKTRHDDPMHHYIFVNQGPGLLGYRKPAKPTPVPGILGVSKQVCRFELEKALHVRALTLNRSVKKLSPFITLPPEMCSCSMAASLMLSRSGSQTPLGRTSVTCIA